MTDLQISLMAIGGTIVVAVVSYNKWQEYKERKALERTFADTPHPEDDSRHGLVSGERAEPHFSDDNGESLAVTAVSDEHGGLTAQSLSSALPDPVENALPTAVLATQKVLPVDPLIDCVIPIALTSNVRGEHVIGPVQALRHVGNKPVNFVGQRENGDWEPLQHGMLYSALLAGVQLANRSGALSEIEFSEMVMRLRQVADELDADPDVPNMTSIMQSARALHQFVTQFDAQLSVNLHANHAPWSINTLLAALTRQGFDVRPDGWLVMPDGEGGNLFSLSTNVTPAAETTSRLTLLLDVPRVMAERDGFGAMVACARSLSHRLDGQLVDDGEQLLTDVALAEIGEQVKTFYADMQAADVPAGSIRALRLFS